MESPRKFNDCYFYYYSTCTKGVNCDFRHEPSALGCETMCSLWQQGKCLDKRCKLRHMELRKNRKQIPCYWETQPGGCRKKHCPFMHKNPEARSDGILPSQPGAIVYDQSAVCGPDVVSAEHSGVPTVSAHAPPAHGHPAHGMPAHGVPAHGVPAHGVPTHGVPTHGVPTHGVPGVQPVPMLWQQQRQVVLDAGLLGVLPGELAARRLEPGALPPYPLPVDPLVVKFEEESDGETPSTTPTKPGAAGRRGARGAGGAAGAGGGSCVPPAELAQLARVQAEAAAYYSYSYSYSHSYSYSGCGDSYSHGHARLSLDELAGKRPEPRASLDFKVLSLDEIRAKKRLTMDNLTQTKQTTPNRKRKSHETIVDSNNKIIKLVRNNSVVYKNFDKPSENNQKVDKEAESRIRTVSEQSDIQDAPDDELEDDCYKFQEVKVDEFTNKPTFVRTKSLGSDDTRLDDRTEDSDSEVQIVCERICYNAKRSCDVIDLENGADDVVDLSDEDDDDVVLTDFELGLGKSAYLDTTDHVEKLTS